MSLPFEKKDFTPLNKTEHGKILKNRFTTAKALLSFEEQKLGHCLFRNIQTPLSAQPKKRYCDITCVPARYQDPKTQLYYADIEGYRFIQTLSQGEINDILQARNALESLRTLRAQK